MYRASDMREDRARSRGFCAAVDGAAAFPVEAEALGLLLLLERRRARRLRWVWRAIQGADASRWWRIWEVYWMKAKSRSWPADVDKIL